MKDRYYRYFSCLIVYLLANCQILSADQGNDQFTEDMLGDVLTEFVDADFGVAEMGGLDESVGRWGFSGNLRLIAAYAYSNKNVSIDSYDYGRWRKLRAQFRPEINVDLRDNWEFKLSGSAYYDFAHNIENLSDADKEYMEGEVYEVEFRDTYIQGRLNESLDLKLGHQIVAWGRSDSIRIVDVINPLDLREIGMVDIEDMRLPLAMMRLDYYWRNWSLTALGIYDIRFNKLPECGSEYSSIKCPAPPESIPHDGGSNTEFAMSLNGIFRGWDISFYLARMVDDTPYVELANQQPQLEYGRISMIGMAGNFTSGNWLWKFEMAQLDDIEFGYMSGMTYSRTDSLLGVEYTGFYNATISLEAAVRHVNNHQVKYVQEPKPIYENTYQAVLRYNKNFFRDRLEAELLLTRFGESLNDGGVSRMQLKQKLEDAISLTMGISLYHKGSKIPFDTIYYNDRLFIELRYYF